MDKTEFLNKIKDIDTIEDEVVRRTTLAEVIDEVDKLFSTNEELSTSNEKFVLDNESLRQANMQLFKMVGVDKEPENPTGEDKTPTEKRKFEDLFNEKGMLK